MTKQWLFGASLLMLLGCQEQGKKTVAGPAEGPKKVAIRETSVRLDKYWYDGTAEVSSYSLHQNRYRDVHPGEAVLVFVTEDFLTDKQVKNEQYRSKQSTAILKMNAIRRFTTGIYDYAIMTSVFAPVDQVQFPFPLKITMSSQDWCGQTFMQLNQVGSQYRAQVFSYFETEGDTDQKVPYTWSEDALWTQVRINPDALPIGKFSILPAPFYARLQHRDFSPQRAEAVLEVYQGGDFAGDQLRVYRLFFPELNRTVEIIFQAESPYVIEGWTDTYPSAFDGQARTTLARRKETLKTPYWKENSLQDTTLRNQLGLSQFLY